MVGKNNWFKAIVFSGDVNWEKQAAVNFLEKSNCWAEGAVWASEHFDRPGFVNLNGFYSHPQRVQRERFCNNLLP